MTPQSLVQRADLGAGFYYLVGGSALREPVEIAGYDARGREVFRATR